MPVAEPIPANAPGLAAALAGAALPTEDLAQSGGTRQASAICPTAPLFARPLTARA